VRRGLKPLRGRIVFVSGIWIRPGHDDGTFRRLTRRRSPSSRAPCKRRRQCVLCDRRSDVGTRNLTGEGGRGLEACRTEIESTSAWSYHRYLEKRNGGQQQLTIAFNAKRWTRGITPREGLHSAAGCPADPLRNTRESDPQSWCEAVRTPASRGSSSPDAHALASGPRLERQQGVYIYRGVY